jgi:hemerythrin-like domain-containing protein
MQARGTLMIEHRLIERMIVVMQRKLKEAEQTGAIDPYFVDTAVDFIHVYADRTHHGKEEDILFSTLEKKGLTAQDQKIMNELIDEHAFGRKTTRSLIDSNALYRKGNISALAEVTSCLKTLVTFYPRHIEKEDKVFFPASRFYFSDEEDQAMLAQFYEFDSNMIHEKYKAVLKNMETGQGGI